MNTFISLVVAIFHGDISPPSCWAPTQHLMLVQLLQLFFTISKLAELLVHFDQSESARASSAKFTPPTLQLSHPVHSSVLISNLTRQPSVLHPCALIPACQRLALEGGLFLVPITLPSVTVPWWALCSQACHNVVQVNIYKRNQPRIIISFSHHDLRHHHFFLQSLIDSLHLVC